MPAEKRKSALQISIVAAVNIILICCVTSTVFAAFSNAEDVSFNQNIENVQTLTDSSANKVKLVIEQHTGEISSVAHYINHYNDIGMTLEEIYSFFNEYSLTRNEHDWQFVQSMENNASSATKGFNGMSLSESGANAFSYPIYAYQELAKVFCKASSETLDTVGYTGEFTDPSESLAKSFAVTAVVRIRSGEDYEYGTLMMLIRSEYLNNIISTNNSVDSLSYFDYSNIIVDNRGNYVISNSYFQGTNIIDYIELYNTCYSTEDRKGFIEKLGSENYTDVMYYLNSRGQDCAYTVVPVQDSDWHIVSIVPLSSFHSSYNFGRFFLLFAVFFFALFIIDVLFILGINRTLRIRTKEAKEANESKSVFLPSMSHDIRTPMNAIIGMTVIAEKQLEEKEIDRVAMKDCISSIQLSGNHLLTLINDILDISKIESGTIVLHPSDFSIADTVSNVIDICRSRISEKSMTFDAHIENVEHEYVNGDSLRVNQIFINILTNAIKYTHSGGKIVLKLTEEPVKDKPDTARYIYTVSDNGIGMTPEFVNTIFDRFSRAVDTRINSVQGTGLGMAIVKQLVDLMGGTITVESVLDVGSTFTVTLEFPLIHDKFDTSVPENLPVLLIDDDPILLKTVKGLLSDAGAEVDTAEEGEIGIRMAKDRLASGNGYQIIFVDWKMSLMSGYDAVKTLNAALGDTARIIVMTAYNISEIERSAREAGAEYLLTKPLFKSKLIAAVQNVMSEKEYTEVKKTEAYPDLRMLIAEDNDTNWKVINKILKFYQINADRAVNGQAAVEMVQKNTYDIVFMDIQMPVMNGYEATKAIRGLDDSRISSMPIYAMTADTFASDVEKCRAAGMNGHLSKPINVDIMLDILKTVYQNRKKLVIPED